MFTTNVTGGLLTPSKCNCYELECKMNVQNSVTYVKAALFKEHPHIHLTFTIFQNTNLHNIQTRAYMSYIYTNKENNYDHQERAKFKERNHPQRLKS